MADRLLRSRQQAHHLGHRQSGAAIRSAVAPGRQSLHQFGGRARRQYRQAAGTSSTRRTTPGTTTKSASTCSTTSPSTARRARWSAHFGRNGFFYSLDRTNGSFIKGGQYVNDLNWTKGLDPKTGKPLEYDPELDVQTYVPAARALRGDPMKRTCPTWHGGVAYQPTAYNPVKQIAYGVGAEGCFTRNGAAAAFKGPDGGLDKPRFAETDLHAAISITARSPPMTPSTTRCWRRR